MDTTTTASSAPVTSQQNNYGESSSLPFPEVVPFPTPVDPALLLNEITAAIRLFIVMTPEQVDAAALWGAFTWFTDVVEVAPLAVINAPEKACGKSLLLDVIGRMSARPLAASNVSTAALFRSMEQWNPTMLIDEADTFIYKNDEIKGLINAGHTRSGAFVVRVVGDNHEVKSFTVWSAKAMAGISLEKHLPDPTLSRGIVFNLRRKLPDESVERLRHAEAGLFEGIASKLARFSDDYAKQVQEKLKAAGFRVEIDGREEKIGYKIREAQMQKIPYMLVVADKEIEENAVNVRKYGEQKSATIDFEAFLDAFRKETEK